MISVRNLTKRFGEVVAVDDVSFDVEQGQIMGFLGPNGAGKTTTIRILTGYLPATQGGVQIAGLDVLRQSIDVRRQIGYLPEAVPLYPEMRVEEYLRFRVRIKEVPRAKVAAEVERVMEHCALTHMRRRLVGHLSKGYRQRVGLADALIGNPPILILDEPTGGLDPHQRQEVLELIRSLAGQHTILLSSHVLAEVQTISTRVMIISAGACSPAASARRWPHSSRRRRGSAPRSPATRRRCAPPFEASGALADFEVEVVDGWCHVKATPLPDTDGREEVGQAVHEAGLRLRELVREQLSLQELFLRITAQAAHEEGASS